jgi:esterase/lipase superfamily enzyme
MIVITNRNIDLGAKPEKRFGGDFNIKGPNELTICEVTKGTQGWYIDLLDDEIKSEAKEYHNRQASEIVFLRMQKRMAEQNRNCLFYVHGFNNDFKTIIEQGKFIEDNYDIEVVIFSWPSNGGGVKGVLSYKSDKREAQLSVPALDRTFELLNRYLINHKQTACNQNFNLLMHSMGNYLFKNLMKSSAYEGETLLFDNIILASADVNNKNHEHWVDKISFRKRLYITINEDDSALLASRLKFGEKQGPRLGHFTRNLNSEVATYIDFTDVADSSHSYFQDKIKSKEVFEFFNLAFNGHKAEYGVRYDGNSNAFIITDN